MHLILLIQNNGWASGRDVTEKWWLGQTGHNPSPLLLSLPSPSTQHPPSPLPHNIFSTDLDKWREWLIRAFLCHTSDHFPRTVLPVRTLISRLPATSITTRQTRTPAARQWRRRWGAWWWRCRDRRLTPIRLGHQGPDDDGSDEGHDDGSAERGQEVDPVVVQQGNACDVFHVRTWRLHNLVQLTAVP